MSRIIEVADTVIKQPELLPKAVEFLNNLGNYAVVECKLEQDADGNVKGGFFHLATGESRYGKGHVFLRYHGKRGDQAPSYNSDGTLNGHFTLMADEDWEENKRLGNLISDHYNAQVVKKLFEEQGHQVEFTVGEDGAIAVDAYEQAGVAPCCW